MTPKTKKLYLVKSPGSSGQERTRGQGVWMDGLSISQVPAATLLKILVAYNKNFSLVQRSVIGWGRSALGCRLGSGLLNV